MTNQEKLQKMKKDSKKRIADWEVEAKQVIDFYSSLSEISGTDIDMLMVKMDKIRVKITDLEKELSTFERVQLMMDF
ncbi:hypothetical protein ABE137_12430 [Brevibacillus laterosporus]|uniref:hypothetical protein n=1 Tax=Brevibacillus phage Sundance TaxID=1691958 RepID=UPI0006BC9AD1|nr:hypothetical protein AVT09_gp165 [Brevibacillus phage Sundance]ALA47981.1 hypothetical protein SUNDANCE_165 [Brevibacillus phage Sundance]